jgi:hypothetical protein
MRRIYCGNNRRHASLRDGTAVIGTRNQCLRKGFGVGFHVLPYDPEYARRFVPIDERKIYCGDQKELPAGYDLVGSNGMCYSKGIGAGRAKRARQVRGGPAPRAPGPARMGFGKKRRKSPVRKSPIRKSPIRKSPIRKSRRKNRARKQNKRKNKRGK